MLRNWSQTFFPWNHNYIQIQDIDLTNGPNLPTGYEMNKMLVRNNAPSLFSQGAIGVFQGTIGKNSTHTMHVACVYKQSMRSLQSGFYGACTVGCWFGACIVGNSHLKHSTQSAHQFSSTAAVSPKTPVGVLTGVLALQAVSMFSVGSRNQTQAIRLAGQSLYPVILLPSPGLTFSRLEKCRFSTLSQKK